MAALRASVALAAAATMGLSSAYASAQEDENFFEGQEDGWFWYEDPVLLEEVVDEESPAPPTPEPEQLEGPPPMSVEWLQEQFPILRNRAIDNPTPHNVSAYKYLERIMMDKAQHFSDMSRTVVQQDPLLDENLRVPFASAAKTALMGSMKDAKRELLSDLAKVVGVWVFYEQSCRYCKAQIAPLERFVKEHGFETTIITKDGRFDEKVSGSIGVRSQTGQFSTLGIDFTPTVMMVNPPNDLYVVSQGFVSKIALEDRLLGAAHRYGLLTDEDYNRVVPTRRGLLAANGEDENPEINWDDSREWVPFLQDRLREAYGFAAEDSEQ